MSKLIDITGKRFGQLVVSRCLSGNRWGNRMWLCLCICGDEVVVAGGNLQSGNTKSCGCLRTKRTMETKTTHGHTKNRKPTSIYRSWQNIIQRCTNRVVHNYSDYGGRGITLCQEWLKFENFIRDMACGWKPGLTIDRIDNHKGYSKDNCRWATKKEQARNRRSNRFISCFGKTQTLVEWSEETGIGEDTITQRLGRGWETEKALTASIRKKR